MVLDVNHLAFLELLKSGLWKKEARLSVYNDMSFEKVFQIATEQSVMGLVAAGLEQVKDIKVPREIALTAAGEVLQLEQRNTSMNQFIEELIEKLRSADIYTLLVKGQGIAQSYERPQWRAAGDVDFLLSKDNIIKAKRFLTTFTSTIEEDKQGLDHYSMSIGQWEVELHGSMRGRLWRRLDSTIDKAQDEVFYGGKVRSWLNGHTQVFLPGIDEDLIFVFSHVLQHFFKEGVGLRQLCDWCRFVWTYREKIDRRLLQKRLKEAGAISEWMAFSALAVEWLGMPDNDMPLYVTSNKWSRKAKKILQRIFETGNFGHNRDKSFYKKHSVIVSKIISLYQHTNDSIKCFRIFPLDSIKSWWSMLFTGVGIVLKGK